MHPLRALAREIEREILPPHDFVQTSPCGAGQHHPHGLVGVLWRIRDPDSVRIGHCFMRGRLRAGDLWLGVAHTGDCFQTYMHVEEYANGWLAFAERTFGSYGIGDAESVDIPAAALAELETGEFVKKETT